MVSRKNGCSSDLFPEKKHGEARTITNSHLPYYWRKQSGRTSLTFFIFFTFIFSPLKISLYIMDNEDDLVDDIDDEDSQ